MARTEGTRTGSMSDIPADVIAMAHRIVEAATADGKCYNPWEAVAKAIIAERERCAAKIDHIRKLLNSQFKVIDIGREDEAYRIAAEAIRKGGV